ncbi:CBO0543 family protein [Alkalihalobacillus sp. AL-G]|uniref:CBO0543 family protein n=1 Tax=Alkalihalobacillus sp. AL-G TaxID=2926399 RepID=UPI00272AFD4F|nr:CBO0543 family protein [Alkalihalobacillus sp. AL-G]WLD94513.1 hypothetical protein MOJ78_06400 [Alkalihalobacillus sp. AL-G]
MDWVVMILTIMLFNTIVFFMKKHLRISDIYTTVIFGLLVSALVDVFASFRLQAWGFFDPRMPDFKALLILLGIYPAAAAMIINWYPYDSARGSKLVYLIGWAIFSTGYEWLSLEVGMLWHKNWNLFYSFILYPFIYFMLIIHVRIYRRMNEGRSISDTHIKGPLFMQVLGKKT